MGIFNKLGKGLMRGAATGLRDYTAQRREEQSMLRRMAIQQQFGRIEQERVARNQAKQRLAISNIDLGNYSQAVMDLSETMGYDPQLALETIDQAYQKERVQTEDLMHSINQRLSQETVQRTDTGAPVVRTDFTDLNTQIADLKKYKRIWNNVSNQDFTDEGIYAQYGTSTVENIDKMLEDITKHKADTLLHGKTLTQFIRAIDREPHIHNIYQTIEYGRNALEKKLITQDEFYSEINTDLTNIVVREGNPIKAREVYDMVSPEFRGKDARQVALSHVLLLEGTAETKLDLTEITERTSMASNGTQHRQVYEMALGFQKENQGNEEFIRLSNIQLDLIKNKSQDSLEVLEFQVDDLVKKRMTALFDSDISRLESWRDKTTIGPSQLQALRDEFRKASSGSSQYRTTSADYDPRKVPDTAGTDRDEAQKAIDEKLAIGMYNGATVDPETGQLISYYDYAVKNVRKELTLGGLKNPMEDGFKRREIRQTVNRLDFPDAKTDREVFTGVVAADFFNKVNTGRILPEEGESISESLYKHIKNASYLSIEEQDLTIQHIENFKSTNPDAWKQLTDEEDPSTLFGEHVTLYGVEFPKDQSNYLDNLISQVQTRVRNRQSFDQVLSDISVTIEEQINQGSLHSHMGERLLTGTINWWAGMPREQAEYPERNVDARQEVIFSPPMRDEEEYDFVRDEVRNAENFRDSGTGGGESIRGNSAVKDSLSSSRKDSTYNQSIKSLDDGGQSRVDTNNVPPFYRPFMVEGR